MPPNKSLRRRGAKREVVFDPEARKSYLCGFSERKRQRRAYGLAHQKVKDRKAKIDQRKAEKKDEMQRIEQAEQQKEELIEEQFLQSQVGRHAGEDSDEDSKSSSHSNDGESDSDSEKEDRKQSKKAKKDSSTTTYNDQQTEVQWGGHVTVTTSVLSLDPVDDSDDGFERKERKAGGGDVEQRFAGSVEKYMKEMKGKMPGKKKKGHSSHHAKRKGKNGAADMKGIGGAGALKVAQKVLSKTKQNQKFSGRQQEGRKKKRKRRR